MFKPADLVGLTIKVEIAKPSQQINSDYVIYEIEEEAGSGAVLAWAQLSRRMTRLMTEKGTVRRHEVATKVSCGHTKFYVAENGDHIAAFTRNGKLHGLVMDRFGRPALAHWDEHLEAAA